MKDLEKRVLEEFETLADSYFEPGDKKYWDAIEFSQSFIPTAFHQAYSQGREDCKEEVGKEIEKLIDDNDDGMWAGRETADKILSIIRNK